MTTGPYQEHILDAADVCSNCLRKNRVERVDPVMSRSGLRHELDAHYSRDRRETTVEYFDGGDEPTRAKTVFCRCGVDGAHERFWTDDDVDRSRFKDLLKALAWTLDRKGVTAKRKTLFAHALGHFDSGAGIDEALARALDTAIATATASHLSDPDLVDA